VVDILQKGMRVRWLVNSRSYEKDVEPPLTPGDTNTTASMGLTILCATPVGDHVVIEGWTRIVSVLNN